MVDPGILRWRGYDEFVATGNPSKDYAQYICKLSLENVTFIFLDRVNQIDASV